MDWYRAVTSRDPRFDGVVFVGVTTTGVYCRPVCTARTPRRERCRFFRSAAEAEREGFRACFLCRPERAPGSSAVDASARLVRDAARLIEEGASDVEELAARLGVSARHVRRVLAAELSVTPVELLQTRRAGLARQLLLETTLPITDVAFASGFASVRRFNAVVRERFGRSPTELRRSRRARRDGLSLRLDVRPPFDFESLLAFHGARAIPGVESVDLAAGTYRRTVAIAGCVGWIVVQRAGAAVVCEASLSLAPALVHVVARVRRMFDLDAQPAIIAEHLARDPRLAPLVEAAPGLRLPGAFEGFETAVRAILGQQVSVKAATTLAERLAAAHGARIETPHPELRLLFPEPRDLLSPSAIGVPAARARAVAALASAVHGGALSLDGHAPVERTLGALLELPGVGDWTAQYVAMRALSWPDAFPAGDLGVRQALGVDTRGALATAEPWRPWRAYAVMHLWREHARIAQSISERRRLRRAG